MLFEIAKSVEIVIAFGKAAIYPKILYFMQKDCFFINFQKKPETRTKVVSCLRESTFCQKSQFVKLDGKLSKSQLSETNLDLN